MARLRINHLIILAAAVAALCWAAIRWPQGASIFGFESTFWDAGLLPILGLLLVAATRTEHGRRRRFQIGFAVFGSAVVVVYVLCCMRSARSNPVLVLLPYQTGFWIIHPMRRELDLKPWTVFIDTVVLILIPLLIALLGAVVVSVRITLRGLMTAVAVVAILLGLLVTTRNRARRYHRMGNHHRNQIVGSIWFHLGPDGNQETVILDVDRDGNPVSPHQQKLDRWHEDMAQLYWRAPYYPWSPAVKESPPPE